MSLRARIFIIISLAILAVLAVSIILIMRNKAKQAAKQSTQVENMDKTESPATATSAGNLTGSDQSTKIPEGIPIKSATALENEQNGVKQLAKIFVERYGTYSTENNYQNIKDLEGLSTDALWKSINSIISKTRTSTEFMGVTTRVITTELSKWEKNSAVVALKALRAEEKQAGALNKYLDYTVSLIKNGQDWLVDKISWK
ncbi:MAG: hypothetical protein AAB348_02895 [Patescibacteria group bacterium]